MLESVALYWVLAIFLILAAIVLVFYTVGFEKFMPIVIVENQEAWVIDRLGKDRVLYEGINRILPGLDRIERKVNLREFFIDPPEQNIITKDQIKISVDMIATVKIVDPLKAVNEVDSYEESIKTLVMTSVLAKMGTLELSAIQQNLADISKEVVIDMQKKSMSWGIEILQVSFENIDYSDEIKSIMEKDIAHKIKNEMKLEDAEAKSKASITEAEGFKKAAAFKADALVHEISTLQKIMPDMDNGKILEFLKSLDYIHSMKNLSQSDNAKFVIYPSDGPSMDKIMSTEYMSQSMSKK